MKFKNIITFFLCIFSVTHQTFCTLSVSQYAPDSFFQKPYFSENYFANISTIFSGGYATHAFNKNSNQVPFLQQFGTEDFLQRFVDPSLDRDNIVSLGKGELSGHFQYRQLIVSCYKNIMHGLFIEGATVIQDLSINSITANFVETETPLTNDQINYLEELQTIIPSTINRSGMFTTAFYLGFNKTFTNFKHLDFIDILLKAGFASPEWMYENNNSILQFPFNENLNFGYPIIGAVSFGLLDWMTLGWSGTVEPFQPTIKYMPVNNSKSNNQLLLPETALTNIDRGPLFSSSVYIEADHIIAGISGTVGYTYTTNLAYHIQPLNSINFPTAQANRSAMLDSWNLSSLYFQFDVDFATESTPSAPVITIFCAIPVSGELCPETNIFGGSCNFQISYAF